MATPRKKNPQPGGRPTKYDPKYHLKKVGDLRRANFSEARIAKFFDISESTLSLWKTEYPEFSEELRSARDNAVTELTRSFHKRAHGYKFKEVKVEIEPAKTVTERVWVPNPDAPGQFMEIDREMSYPAREISRTETTKQIPPDPGSIQFMLKNLDAENWRDTAHIDHTSRGNELGKGLDLSLLSDADVREMARIEAKAKGEEL